MINVKEGINTTPFQFKNDCSTAINSNENIKLKDLYIELERKDLVIRNLQSQLLLSQSQSKAIQTKKTEPNFSDSNIQMMICQKDKTIKELDSIIKTNDNDCHKLKQILIDKEGELNHLKQEINETNVKLQNAQLRLKGKENEMNTSKQEQDQRHSDCRKEKMLLESKTNQLIEIVKQYSKEISDCSIQIQSLETEKKSLLNINQSLSNQINDNNDKISSYERQMAGLRNMADENNQLKRIINSLRNDISKEMQINAELHKRNQELEDTRNILINKTDKMVLIQNDNETLKRNNDSLAQENGELAILVRRLQESDDRLKAIGPWIAEEICVITEWISTYMGIYYDYEINPITAIDTNTNRASILPDNIQRVINSFKQFLYQKRNSINEDQYNYEDTIHQQKTQLDQLLIKIDSLQYDNKELNQRLLKKEEESEKAKIERERCDLSISKLQNDISLTKAGQTKEREQYQLALSQLNETINQEISSLLHKDYLVKFYDILCQKSSTPSTLEPNLQSILEDSLSKVLHCLRAIVKEYELVPLLTKENEVLKKEKDGLIKKVEFIQKDNDLKLSQSEVKYSNDKLFNDQVYKDKMKTSNEEIFKVQIDYDKVKKEKETALATIQLLEKRLKNIQTELELKEMQIRSQEQIINRRTQQNANLNDTIIISLESDKAKLIEDNVTLIKENSVLKDTIKELTLELNSVNKSAK